MKTIREKSEEHQETALKEKGAILRVDVRNAFKAGANYVLDEIEKVVQCDLNSHSTFKLKCIKQIIEELKK